MVVVVGDHNIRNDESTVEKKDNTKVKKGRITYILSMSHVFPHWFLSRWCIVVMIALSRQHVAVALQQPTRESTVKTVEGLPVHRTHLGKQQTQEQQTQPYCFALSSIMDLPSSSNFLATQVWPSARVAAKTLEERVFNNDLGLLAALLRDDDGDNLRSDKFTICELGCGPGMPSITAAAAAAAAAAGMLNKKVDIQVIATDVDDFALELVNAAAKEQGLNRIVSARPLDLIEAGKDEWEDTTTNSWIKDVDLFVMSDVFECEAVAVGAARLTQRVLSWTEGSQDDIDNINNNIDGTRQSFRKKTRMWVFAQTDRAQREVYLRELRNLSLPLSEEETGDSSSSPLLEWSAPGSYNLDDLLWLCDVDETLVDYG